MRDFIVIGAQKSATTSLFKYLSAHPDLYLPKDKEAPFFTNEQWMANGLDWYYENFFSDAEQNQLWGKVTPQYMTDPLVSGRIYSVLPDTKLIALLRHPLDRAFSHYRMCVRRNMEPRGFEDAMLMSMQPENLLEAQRLGMKVSNETKCYVAWSEYGRILSNYLNCFQPQQLLIVHTEELDTNPEKVIDEILSFLGLEMGFRPPNLGERFHKGGDKTWLPSFHTLRKNRLLKIVARRFPKDLLLQLAYWYEQAIVVPAKREVSVELSVATREEAIAYFKTDLHPLYKKMNMPIYWPELN